MIDAKRISEILDDCFFTEAEMSIDLGGEKRDHIAAQGLRCMVALHPGRVAKHKEEVKKILSNLGDEFMIEKGGGTSFLNMCMDKNGNQWGEHPDMDELVMLGVACGFVSFPIPKDLWMTLPGGMPYIAVDLRDKETQPTTGEVQ